MELIEYRGKTVELIAKPIKHCYLRVKSGGIVLLTYNKRLQKNEAIKLLDKHWDSILTKLSMMNMVKDENKLISGSSVYYLGEQYKLHVVVNGSKGVEVVDNSLYLFSPNDDYPTKNKIIKEWYYEQARHILEKQYQNYLPKIDHWNVEAPKLRYRTMKRRWGSYNKIANAITLNTELVKATPELVNYIIAHELCHILHFNHSKAFYNSLTKLHPNWKEQKVELDSFTHKFLG